MQRICNNLFLRILNNDWSCFHERRLYNVISRKSIVDMKLFKIVSSHYKRKHGISSNINKTIQTEEKSQDIESIRNIGIMAHVDAGKTTTTERMLYYSGYTRSMGEVDDGDTIMDYMEQERTRGITITSAAITFNWKSCKINLIDTPGHVDFTVEVERAVCVLDGAIAILDASAGVEPQTYTVWQQADRYRVPRIIYLNKMDKQGANLQMCVDQITQKLKCQPLVLQQPIFHKKRFIGVMDLVSMKKVVWESKNQGKIFHLTSVEKETNDNNNEWESAVDARRKLVEIAADLDSDLADQVLTKDKWEEVESQKLKEALRRITLNRSGILVMCGSSYKNVGVQLLMDAIIDYLPSPTEVNCENAQFYKNQFCGLVFKILYNRQKDFVSFIRVYSGELRQGQKLFNVNQNCSEKIGKLFDVYADEYREISKAEPGNIVAVTGLKSTVTGDTVTSSSSVANEAMTNFWQETGTQTDNPPLLGGFQLPEPVFFCSIEPASLAHQKNLDFALECLKREDPSLKVRLDSDTGQIVLSGMGELHLDVIKNRIHKEFKADADLGALQVAYKETIEKSTSETTTLSQTIGSTKSHVVVTLNISPSNENSPLIYLDHNKENQENFARIHRPHMKALEQGIKMALQNGTILGFPVTDVKVGIGWLDVANRSILPSISAAASQCVAVLLKKSCPVLLEPFMRLEVMTPRTHLHDVLGDLSKRRGQIMGVDERQDFKVVNALVPLSELMGYSTSLRILSSGLANFSMVLDSYQKMSSQDQEQAIQRIRGF